MGRLHDMARRLSGSDAPSQLHYGKEVRIHFSFLETPSLETLKPHFDFLWSDDMYRTCVVQRTSHRMCTVEF